MFFEGTRGATSQDTRRVEEKEGIWRSWAQREGTSLNNDQKHG